MLYPVCPRCRPKAAPRSSALGGRSSPHAPSAFTSVFVPPLAAVLAGLTTVSTACAPVIPPLDARVKTAESGRAAASAHPFDVSATAEAGEGIALQAMVAARKRARADEIGSLAKLESMFPALGASLLRNEYRAMIHQDGGDVDDLLTHLSELSEALERDGKLPENALLKRPVLGWAEGELGGATGAPTAAAGAGAGSSGGNSGGPRSLGHRIGLAASSSSSSSTAPGGGGPAAPYLTFDVCDPLLLDNDAAPLRPGGRVRAPPYGRGAIVFLRIGGQAAPPSVPASTPLTLEVVGVGVAMDWGALAVLRPAGMRVAPPNDGEVNRDNAAFGQECDSGPSNVGGGGSGGGGGSSRPSGVGRGRRARIADAIEDADAALARKLQSEEIAEAMAEEGEDVDAATLMHEEVRWRRRRGMRIGWNQS